jgi:plastocyanin
MFSSKKILGIAVAVILCFGCAFSSFAATARISVGGGGLVFTPATTNIAVNDQVIWTWGGPVIPHSTTSGTVIVTSTMTNAVPDGLWNSGVLVGAHSFTNTFGSAGNFPYYCQIHFTNGMTGTIIVSGPSLPPNIAITNPANGAIFSEPANVTIQATATDSNSGSSVTNVQFLVGPTVLANKTAAPFFTITNNLAAGSYEFSAIASDNVGLKATNTIAINVVTPLPLVIGVPQLSSDSFQFSYAANVGLSYVVQQSTNLAAPNWITLFTNTAASNPVVFVDNHATNNPGFYRVGLLPNP